MYVAKYQAEYLDYCMRPGRDWKISIPGIDSDDLTNFSFESVLGDKSIFTIGTVTSSKITVELRLPKGNESRFKNTTLSPSLLLKTYVVINEVLTEVWQSVPLGKFIVDSVSRQNDVVVSLEAHDKMCHDKYGNKEFSYSENFPISCADLANNVASKMGCRIANPEDLPDIDLQHPNKINNTSSRNVLGYIAALYGGFCRINREGNIEFFKQCNTEIVHTNDNGIRELTEKEDKFTIGGFKCQVKGGNNFLTSGNPNSEESTIELINYDMTQELLDAAFAEYKGKLFYSLILNGMVNPALDCGDILTIVNQNNVSKPIQIQAFAYSIKGGPQGTYECEYDLEDMEWDEVSDKEDLEDIYERLEALENAEPAEPDLEDVYDRLENLENAETPEPNLDPIYNRIENLEDRVSTLEEKCSEMNQQPTPLLGLTDKTIYVGDSYTFVMNKEGTYVINTSNNYISKEQTSTTDITITGEKVGTCILSATLNDQTVSCTITVLEKDNTVVVYPGNYKLLDCGSYSNEDPISNLYSEKPLTYSGGRLKAMTSTGHNWWTSFNETYLKNKGMEPFGEAFQIKGLAYFVLQLPPSDTYDTKYIDITISYDYNINKPDPLKVNYGGSDVTESQISLWPSSGVVLSKLEPTSLRWGEVATASARMGSYTNGSYFSINYSQIENDNYNREKTVYTLSYIPKKVYDDYYSSEQSMYRVVVYIGCACQASIQPINPTMYGISSSGDQVTTTNFNKVTDKCVDVTISNINITYEFL